MNYEEIENNEYLNKLLRKLDLMLNNYNYPYIFISCNNEFIKEYIESKLKNINKIIPLYNYSLSTSDYLNQLKTKNVLLCNIQKHLDDYKNALINSKGILKLNELDRDKLALYYALVFNREIIHELQHSIIIIGNEDLFIPLLHCNQSLISTSYIEFIDECYINIKKKIIN